MQYRNTTLLGRAARALAFIAAVSFFLAVSFQVQHQAYEEKSREAVIAAERLQALKRQDYDLRFHAMETDPGSSMTRRDLLQGNALQIRQAEAAWQRASAEQYRLRGMSLIWSIAVASGIFCGLFLTACLLAMAACRLLGAGILPRTQRAKPVFASTG